MSNYKIIACDLDGTLLNSEMSVSRENLEAIKELNKKGVYFVPSTGRTLAEIPEEIRENSDVRYVSISNGATVIDKETGNNIYFGLSNELLNKVLDVIEPLDAFVLIRQGGKSYVEESLQSDEHHIYYNNITPHIDVAKNYACYEKDLIKKMREYDNVEVIAVSFHTMEEREKCVAALSQIDGISMVAPWEYAVEIFSEKAGKGKALIALAKATGVDSSEIIAVGDSDNDVTQIKAAGLGIAVSNASEDLKKIADKVICSNDEHAIKYILEHILK